MKNLNILIAVISIAIASTLLNIYYDNMGNSVYQDNKMGGVTTPMLIIK